MLLDQIIDLNIIQIAAIPMILLVCIRMGSYYYSKDYYNSLDTIGHIYRSCKCWYLSFIKNRNFGIILFFYNVIPWSIPTGGHSLHYAIDFDTGLID
jgi:hypothetical protein